MDLCESLCKFLFNFWGIGLFIWKKMSISKVWVVDGLIIYDDVGID